MSGGSRARSACIIIGCSMTGVCAFLALATGSIPALVLCVVGVVICGHGQEDMR